MTTKPSKIRGETLQYAADLLRGRVACGEGITVEEAAQFLEDMAKANDILLANAESLN